RNWPFGAALGFGLLAMVLLAMTFYALKSGKSKQGISL
ncbi:MAG TPA: ABC transporter permease, partial [Rhodospirillaceae bacterium]|nr:ABC transporter permease [Rhodospirillaceae bacterium]